MTGNGVNFIDLSSDSGAFEDSHASSSDNYNTVRDMGHNLSTELRTSVRPGVSLAKSSSGERTIDHYDSDPLDYFENETPATDHQPSIAASNSGLKERGLFNVHQSLSRDEYLESASRKRRRLNIIDDELEKDVIRTSPRTPSKSSLQVSGLSSATPHKFKMPKVMERAHDRVLIGDGESREMEPRKKKQRQSISDSHTNTPTSSRGTILSIDSASGSSVIQAATFTPAASGTWAQPRFSRQSTVRPQDKLPRGEVNSSHHSNSGLHEVGQHERPVHRRGSPDLGSLAGLPSTMTEPPPDLNSLATTLSSVPEILISLHDQYSQSFRDLATEVNTVKEANKSLRSENAQLRAHVDKLERNLVDQTARRIDAIETTFLEKMDEVIHSNDEVVFQQNPVAGGAHGGPRLTTPAKAHSAFRGL